jgi:hypothetical protein
MGVDADLPLTARAVYDLIRPVVVVEVVPVEVLVPDVVPDVEVDPDVVPEVDPVVEEAVVPLVMLE